jgi:radical SAM superfamily enzyme YgiQ (UPF0313 family)
MANIIFLNDLSSKEGFLRTIGPYRLATELRLNGFSVQVIDCLGYWIQHDISALYKMLEKLVTDDTYFLGISTTFLNNSDISRTQASRNARSVDQHDSLMAILDFVKTLNPKIKTVFGGPNVSDYNEKCDIKVLGYADTEIVKLANELRNKRYFPVKTVNGIDIRDSDVKAASFDFTNSGTNWHESDCLTQYEILPIEISRGCIFKCTFCSYPLNGKSKLDYWRSSESLRSELIRNYEQYKVTRYIIGDDTFNDSPEKLEMVKSVIDSLPFKIQFICYLRLDLLIAKPHTVQLLKDIGLEYAFFGIETLNDKTGKAINKGLGKSRILNGLKAIYSVWGNDVKIHISLIVGLPYESKESINDSINLIAAMPEVYSVSWQPMVIDTGTSKTFVSEIDKDPAKFGYRILPNQKNTKRAVWVNKEMNYMDEVRLWQEADAKMGEVGKANFDGFRAYAVLNILKDKEIDLRDREKVEQELPAAKLKYFNSYRDNLLLYLGMSKLG